MMSAQTQNPECGCITHVGPHWMHMDYLDRQRNLSHLESLALAWETHSSDAATLAFHAFVFQEEIRLHKLARNMERAGMERLDYSLLGPGRKDLAEVERMLWARINACTEREGTG